MIELVLQYKSGVTENRKYPIHSNDFPFLLSKPKTIEFYSGVKFEFLEENYNLVNSNLILYYGEI